MHPEVIYSALSLPIGGNSNWWRELHDYVPLGITGGISWSIWLIRFSLSRVYRPVPPGFIATTSVVVPAFREDPDILDQCLSSWLAEDPTEVIVVPDLADQTVIRRLQQRAVVDPRLRVIPFAHAGKRSALGVGIRAATSEIVVLSDSDTMWRPGLLAAVLAPFRDPDVGAVGTRQNVYLPGRSTWRRVANWLLDVRFLDYVRAQAWSGAVACVSGRTAAYRRSVVMRVLPHLEEEYFLGRKCDAGDDGRLTWLVLASGYRTTYQSTARALSMFPDTCRAFLKQRLRWSRNSYRAYLTAIWKGWLWRQPFVCQITVLQVLFTPITMTFAMYYFVTWVRSPSPLIAVLAVVWLLGGRGVRGMSHLRECPGDIWLLPLVALMTIVVALPVKAYAFVTMNLTDWLTRSPDQETLGGEAQSAASLG